MFLITASALTLSPADTDRGRRVGGRGQLRGDGGVEVYGGLGGGGANGAGLSCGGAAAAADVSQRWVRVRGEEKPRSGQLEAGTDPPLSRYGEPGEA